MVAAMVGGAALCFCKSISPFAYNKSFSISQAHYKTDYRSFVSEQKAT